uniref:Uncharacterized protein n=2 Tax=Lepeophtheirus salmonis TaxID=72036 RepID=A0A0K2V6M5_LEPSM
MVLLQFQIAPTVLSFTVFLALSNNSTFDYLPESTQWFVAPQPTTSSSDTSWIITKWKLLLLHSILQMLVRQSKSLVQYE